MIRRRALVLVPTLLAVLSGHCALAAVDAPWNLPALSAKPEEILRAAGASSAPKDGDIEMLFEEHVYRLDERGREHRTSHRVYRFLTDKGVDDWSTTEADWSPWCEDKPVFHVRVISPDGQVHPLDPESIGEVATEQESPSMFSDAKLLRAPLPAVVVGAVVEEEIDTREVRSLFDRGIVERFSLGQQYAVRKLRLVIDAPSALPLNYKVVGGAAKPTRTEAQGRTQLVFELGPLAAMDAPEPYLPAEASHWPQVVFSTGKSWNDVAKGYAALVESRLDLETVKPLVREALAKLPPGETADRAKIIERLLSTLRGQIRYTGVEFGRGAIVPRSSRETLARRYGDCKDQATLLVAMLRAAGIPAHVALLRTGRYADVVASLPGLGDFDHAIVFVPGPPGMWIDPSARCMPAGQLPLMDQDRLALLADPETRELVHTDKMDYTINTSEQVIELFPTDSGKGRVHITVTCGGSCDEDVREDYASLSLKTLRKHWKDYLKDQFHTATVPRLEYSSPLDLTKVFRVTADVSEAKLGQFDEAEGTITLMPDALFQRLPDFFRGIESDAESGAAKAESTAEERRGPLLLPEPHIRQLQYRINLPAGYTVKALPASSVKQHGPATIGQKFEMVSDNVVAATFRIDTGSGRFTADEVEELRQAIAELAKDESSPWEVKINLESAAGAHIAAGRVAEAVVHARDEMGHHPERWDQRYYYSRLLLKAGLGDAAEAEARKAIDLAPRNAAAYANLGRVLTHDKLGRQFRPGMVWGGAAAAYLKALELEPADVATRIDWAILLEHDEAGMHYAEGTPLEESIDEYRKAQRQLGRRNRNDALETKMAWDLLYIGEYADLEKLSARAEKSLAWKGFHVAAVAGRLGVLEADKRAAEIAVGNADDRREILQTAAEYLQQSRIYPPAGTLYEAASQNADNAAELLAKGKAVAAQHRMKAADLAQEAPQRLVQQLYMAALGGANARERIPAMFASSTTPQEVADAIEDLRRAVRPALERARKNDIPPQRIIDLVLLAPMFVEGDAAKGYRIRVTGELVEDKVWQVVIENEHAKIAIAGSSAAKTTPSALIDRAWKAVHVGSVSQQTLDDALAAVKQTDEVNGQCLNTLAAVYAELGKTTEALAKLRLAVQCNGDRASDADWYVLGRIAEQYGVPDAAANLYAKVQPAKTPSPTDVYTMAQSRLKKLNSVPSAARDRGKMDELPRP